MENLALMWGRGLLQNVLKTFLEKSSIKYHIKHIIIYA